VIKAEVNNNIKSSIIQGRAGIRMTVMSERLGYSKSLIGDGLVNIN